MVAIAIFGILAAIMSTGVECGFSSAASSSSSNSDGTGHTFTLTSRDGLGTYSHQTQKPGGGSLTKTGNTPGQLFGSANFGHGLSPFNYGPGFSYGSYGVNQPQYTPFPQTNFGFNAPFQPLPFQPIQAIQPFPQLQPLVTPQAFNQYLNSLQQQYIAGGSVAQSTPGATAFASSYLGPTKFYKQQQNYLDAWKNSAFQPGYGGVPNYAYATGAYNPINGYHQTVGVFPPNNNQPNVDTRFNPNENVAGNTPNGYFGIQTSSFSSSSDVNGVKKHKEGASTTVNDNGHVSTYKVEN